MHRRLVLLYPVFALGSALGAYLQTNLVSDLPGVAAATDANLVNPWGIVASSTSPFWVSDNGTGVSTLYNGTGGKLSLTVNVPPPAGGMPPSAPTGVVFNSTSNFAGSHFIFATEDGTISAWSSGNNANLEVDNSTTGAVYKGLAIGNNGTSNLIYAANFNSGNIDVFGPTFNSTTVSGGFKDPNLPAGYAPFDIQNIGGELYVTYALQDAAKHDDVAGPGNGYIDVFDTNGNLIMRLVSNGPLNSPWGLALAGNNFGQFSDDLLVGNFGDGTINAFNPTTGAFLGSLTDASGNKLVDQGLWGLSFGNGASAGSTSTLYLTAGIPGPGAVESNGLFAEIQAVPEPSTMAFLVGGLALLVIGRRRRTYRRIQPTGRVSLA